MKKKFDGKIFMAVFIGVIMIMSTLGFLVGQGGTTLENNNIKVNGIELTPVTTGYTAKVGNSQIGFTNSPFFVNRTKIDQSAINQIKSSSYVIMTSNYTSPYASDIALMEYQLTQILGSQLNVQSQIAFTTNATQLPQATCSNASPLMQVIEFRDGNLTGADYQNNCLILTSASPAGYVELRDRLVYGLFGILT